MDSAIPIVIFILIGGMIIAGAIYAHRQAQKRREEMSALALHLGWAFDPAKDSDHDDEYAQFEIFCHGHSRAAYNTLSGNVTIDQRNFPAKMGDFTYKVVSIS